MKPTRTRWWVLGGAVLLAVVVAPVIYWLTAKRPTARSPADDPSVVFAEQPAVSRNVENGRAFDRATLDLGAVQKIVLPTNAFVSRTQKKQLELSLQKVLAFGGHPASRLSIRTVRHDMGCAVKFENGALVLATYGEWEHWEGRRDMRVHAVVPEEVSVEQRTGLSGDDSAAQQAFRTHTAKREGLIYDPAAPTAEWRRVPTTTDNTHGSFAARK